MPTTTPMLPVDKGDQQLAFGGTVLRESNATLPAFAHGFVCAGEVNTFRLSGTTKDL